MCEVILKRHYGCVHGLVGGGIGTAIYNLFDRNVNMAVCLCRLPDSACLTPVILHVVGGGMGTANLQPSYFRGRCSTL